MAKQQMPPTIQELPLTSDVPTFGRIAYRLGRNASYAAAKSKVFPTLETGGLLRVPLRPALEPLIGNVTPEERAAILAQFCRQSRRRKGEVA